MIEPHLFGPSRLPWTIASHATSSEQVRDQIDKSCSPIKMWLRPGAFEGTAEYKQIGLHGMTIGASAGFDQMKFHLRARPAFRQFVPLSGACQLNVRGRTFDTSKAASVPIPANEEHVMEYGPDFRALLLAFDEDAVSRKFRAIVNPDSFVTPDVLRSVNMSDHNAAAMIRAVTFALQELEAAEGGLPPLIVEEMSQLIIVAFLMMSDPQLSAEAGQAKLVLAPQQVRRVTEYIEAHWSEPLDVGTLAVVTGTSARTIFRSFKAYYGETPMDFLRRVRLTHARRLLSRARPSDTVTGIALVCGFSNIGHFADHYYRQFAERPVETLKRGRWLG